MIKISLIFFDELLFSYFAELKKNNKCVEIVYWLYKFQGRPLIDILIVTNTHILASILKFYSIPLKWFKT